MKKIVIIAGSISVLIGIIILVNFSLPKYTTLDLTRHIKLKYEGYNGEGIVSVESNHVVYDENNADIQEALKHLKYEISPNKDLSNNDKIKVKVIVPKEIKDNRYITVKNVKNTFIVTGLKDREYEKTYKVYTEKNGDSENLISEEYVIVDGVEIPSKWGFSQQEMKRYAQYVHCVQNQDYDFIEDPHNWSKDPKNACEFKMD